MYHRKEPHERPLYLVILVLMILWTATAAADPVEMKISRGVLQSFIDATFPVVVKKDVDLLGVARLPINVHLLNPGSLVLAKQEGNEVFYLCLNMDYEISSSPLLVAPAKGKLGGEISVVLSQDQEFLILSFSEINVQVTPSLTISLASLLKPIRVPLFQAFSVKVQDREIYGFYKNVRIDVADMDLIIRGDLYFDRTQQTRK